MLTMQPVKQTINNPNESCILTTTKFVNNLNTQKQHNIQTLFLEITNGQVANTKSILYKCDAEM